MKKINVVKKVAAVTLLGFTALVATSCGEKVDKTHTIYFYNTMGTNLQTPLAAAISEYEAKFPGWKIKSIQNGNYDDVKKAVVADIAAGTQPDLAYCYPDHIASYLKSGTVVNMSKYINNVTDTVKAVRVNQNGLDENGDAVTTTEEYDEVVGYTATELADFLATYWEEGKAKNYAGYATAGYEAENLLSVPFMKSTEVMYYNKTALDQAGIKKVPTTWDELWEACRVIAEEFPTATPLGYDSEANWFITMCMQNNWGYTSINTPHYLFNNPQTTSWLNQIKGYYEEGLFTVQSVYGGYTSNLFTLGADKGGCVFCIGSSAGASHQYTSTFEIGVAPIPGSKQADNSVDYSCISQGPSLVMFHTNIENADEKELMTWEFVKILLEIENQAAFSKAAGYNSCRLSTNTDVADYKKFLDGKDTTGAALTGSNLLVAKTANVAASLSDRFYTSPAFDGSSSARTVVGTILVDVINGTLTASKALADGVQTCGE